MLSPAALLLIQVCPTIHPGWYFVVDSFTGMLSFFSIAYSMLSDSMPPRHRAASFGLFFGAFFSGIAVGPLLAVMLDHVQVAFVSFLVRVVALVFCLVALPETLRPEIAAGNIEKRRVAPIQATTMLRPLYEMSILCRNKTLVLLTIGTFLSKLVFSADVTLFFYYVENNLGVRDKDVAGMLFLTGCVGMLVQVCYVALGRTDIIA
jgi:Na+/melibiose symporter-like transporter